MKDKTHPLRIPIVLPICWLLIAFSSLIPLESAAQSDPGWEALGLGEQAKARRIFEAELSENPQALPALLGIMACDEMTEDVLAVEAHIGQLLKYHPDPFYQRLFSPYLDAGTPYPDARVHTDRSLGRLLSSIAADSALAVRDFRKADSLYSLLFNGLDWQFCGPFRNRNGYGHVVEFGPETESACADSCASGFGNYRRWSQAVRIVRDRFEFGDYLPEAFDGGTYYARTSFKLAERRTVEIRMERNSAIKIWLNGQLLQEAADSRLAVWENDRIRLELDAGKHQLLVKCSSLPQKYHPFLDYSARFLRMPFDPRSSTDASLGQFGGFRAEIGLQLGIRLTDTLGSLLPGIPGVDWSSAEPNAGSELLGLQVDQLRLESLEQMSPLPPLARLYLRAKCQMAAGMFSEGRAEFESKFSRNPDNPFLRYLYCCFLSHEGDPQYAYELLDSLDLSSMPVLDVMTEQLEFFSFEKYPDQFASIAEGMMAASPRNPDALNAWLSLIEKRDGTEMARIEASILINRNPELLPIVRAFFGEISDPPTEPQLRAAESVRFDRDAQLQLLARDLKYAETEAVIERIRQLRKWYGSLPGLGIAEAELQAMEGKTDSALALMEQAIALRPGQIDIHEAMADLQMRFADTGMAAFHLRKALDASREKVRVLDKARLEGKLSAIGRKATLEQVLPLPELAAIGRNSSDSAPSRIAYYGRQLLRLPGGETSVRDAICIDIHNAKGVEAWREGDFSFLPLIGEVQHYRNGELIERLPARQGIIRANDLQAGDRLIAISNYRNRNPLDLGPHWYLQNYLAFHSPLDRFTLEMAVPAGTQLEHSAHRCGQLERTVRKAEDFWIYRYQLRDLKGFRPEPGVIDLERSYPSIHVSHLGGWEPLINYIREGLYGCMDESPMLDEWYANIERGTDPVCAIYDAIHDRFRVDLQDIFYTGFSPKKNSELFRSAKGNALDLGMLMIRLLRESGMECEAVLVKSKSSGTPPIALSLDFNHLVVRWKKAADDDWKYVDPSNFFFECGVLNELDADSWALPIPESDTAVARPIRLPDHYLNPEYNFLEINGLVSINESGSLRWSGSSKCEGVSAGFMRTLATGGYNKAETDQLLLEYFGAFTFVNPVLKSADFELGRDWSSDVKLGLQITDNAFIRSKDGRSFIPLPFLKRVSASPLLRMETRSTALNLGAVVDMDPVSESINLVFFGKERPKQLPDPVSIENEFFSYDLWFKKKGNRLSIEKRQRFHQLSIPPEKYPEFRKAYNQLVLIDGMMMELK